MFKKNIILFASSVVAILGTTSCDRGGPTSVKIIGPDYIFKNHTVHMDAIANESKYRGDFDWFVSDTNIAQIHKYTGLLIGLSEGTTKVSCVCRYNHKIKDEYTIHVCSYESSTTEYVKQEYTNCYNKLKDDIDQSPLKSIEIDTIEDGYICDDTVLKGTSLKLVLSNSNEITINSDTQTERLMFNPENFDTEVAKYVPSYGKINNGTGEACTLLLLQTKDGAEQDGMNYLIFKGDGTIAQFYNYFDKYTYLEFNEIFK